MFYFDKINGYKVLKSDFGVNFGVSHCFTTRSIRVSDIYSNYIYPQQTHSDHIEIVDERIEYPDTDGKRYGFHRRCERYPPGLQDRCR